MKCNPGQSWLSFFLILILASPAFGQTRIAYGDNHLVSVPCRTVVSFVFHGTINDRVSIFFTECSDTGGVCGGWACFCFDQTVELRNNALDPSSNLVATNNSGGIDTNDGQKFRTRIDAKLPNTGDYTINVFDATAHGNGTGTLSLQNNLKPGQAEWLAGDDVFFDIINTCGELKTYAFQGSGNDVVQIKMTQAAQSAVIPILELYDPRGLAIALPRNGNITADLNLDGNYTILAYSAVAETGAFAIQFKKIQKFLRGDANDNGIVNIADAVTVLSYLFGDGARPECKDAYDANDDGTLNLADAIAILSHLFAHAGSLPPPFDACGQDPSNDNLDCQKYESCE